MTNNKKSIRADAVLWDFDGTLANSAAKNIAITRQILARVAPRLTGANLPRSLRSEADYHVANHGARHWRDLYRIFFGMNTEEIAAAGPLWEAYQMRNDTEVTLFAGVADAVARLAFLPQGICSANASGHIRRVLDKHDLGSAFRSVIGYEDLPHDHQKPAPDGGIKCLHAIFGEVRNKTIIHVGDHIADVLFARGLGKRLGPSNKVISIAVTYSGASPADWQEQPDVIIACPSELTDLVRG